MPHHEILISAHEPRVGGRGILVRVFLQRPQLRGVKRVVAVIAVQGRPVGRRTECQGRVGLGRRPAVITGGEQRERHHLVGLGILRRFDGGMVRQPQGIAILAVVERGRGLRKIIGAGLRITRGLRGRRWVGVLDLRDLRLNVER